MILSAGFTLGNRVLKRSLRLRGSEEIAESGNDAICPSVEPLGYASVAATTAEDPRINLRQHCANLGSPRQFQCFRSNRSATLRSTDAGGFGASRTRALDTRCQGHHQEHELRHLYIERALGESWNAGEADTVADATVKALQALFADLAMLIGNDAVQALYLRALHVSLLFFDRTAQANRPMDALLAELRQNLANHQPADARRAAQALLESLVALLVSLIGQPLTLRLVTSAWGSPSTHPTNIGENRT